jgi:hypothetical protein
MVKREPQYFNIWVHKHNIIATPGPLVENALQIIGPLGTTSLVTVPCQLLEFVVLKMKSYILLLTWTIFAETRISLYLYFLEKKCFGTTIFIIIFLQTYVTVHILFECHVNCHVTIHILVVDVISVT